MKIGIMIGVLSGILVVAIAVIVLFVLYFFPSNRTVFPSDVPTPVTVAIPASSTPDRTSTAGETDATLSGETPALTVTASPTPTPAASAEVDVNFSLDITDISPSGMSANVTAQLTNTGTTDAHNTRARVEAFSKGSLIKINGQNYLDKDLGTILAGDTVTSPVTLGFSFSDAAKIMSEGATFKLTITSDEKTQAFSYDYSI